VLRTISSGFVPFARMRLMISERRVGETVSVTEIAVVRHCYRFTGRIPVPQLSIDWHGLQSQLFVLVWRVRQCRTGLYSLRFTEPRRSFHEWDLTGLILV
jgi:hypothetical protein